MNAPFTLWGILNVTPDSFSDGGCHNDMERAIRQADRMVADGASILDVGGESTRPQATAVSEAEEMRRVIPVIRELVGRCHVPISIDTHHPAVALEAIRHGASIVNDVCGLQGSTAMAPVVAEGNAKVVLMYWRQGGYGGQDVIGDLRHFWLDSLEIADRAGIPRSQIFLDPGIGFAKTFGQNLEILNAIGSLRAQFSEFPLLLGVSRKSFLGQITGQRQPNCRDVASGAVAQFANAAGISHFRVHNVALHREVLTVAKYLKTDKNEPSPHPIGCI